MSEWYLGSEVDQVTPGRRLPGLSGHRLAGLWPGPGLGPGGAGAEERTQEGEGREGGLAGCRGGADQAQCEEGEPGDWSHLSSILTMLTSDLTRLAAFHSAVSSPDLVSD